MNDGSPPLENEEKRLASFRVEVWVCRPEILDRRWVHEFCSPFWRLYINPLEGGCVRVNGEDYPLKAGLIYMIPAWLPFSTGFTSDFNGKLPQNYIHFDLQGIPAAVQKRHCRRVLRVLPSGFLEGLIQQWEDSLETLSWQRYAYANALVYSAMAHVLESPCEENRCFEWRNEFQELQPALDAIESLLHAPPPNPILARQCGLSTGHFIKKFDAAFGMTPGQYRLEKRIMTGARLLTRSPNSLSQIADLAGFADRYHFSKAFKARLGISPAAYRRLHALV